MKNNFNYRIAHYFLERNRLMILGFVVLVLLGVATTFLLKTTGFPQPDVRALAIQTIYPGASADTVASSVTQPLEGAIKSVSGVSTYQSTSSNSVSFIRVDVQDGVDASRVRADIDTAVGAIDFPVGVQTPKLLSPSIDGPDVVFSVAGGDAETLYTVYRNIEQSLSEIPETATVKPLSAIERRLQITLRQNDLVKTGLSYSSVVQQLGQLHETFPVGEATLDQERQSVLTTLGEVSFESIAQLVLRSGTQTESAVLLQDVADLAIEYQFTDNEVPYIGLRTQAGESRVLPALVVYVKAADTIDLGEYTKKVEDLLSDVPNTDFVGPQSELESVNGVVIVEHFTNNEFNQRQVSEVVSGLVGGPLEIDGQWKHIGWFLGGIQLVFLVMLAFVSWRAALVAAAAIPLSLVFANIYLYFAGHDLNTLVLFSLVLVIGLVVDPALVILESIQRKIDLGLRGKEAALAAITDVGMGLFLATLTNIIVFLPFAVISGFLGQIFAYIPLTVIPATIGSYVVPLIFLAWIGGLFLRPSKRKGDDEIKNLWPIAQWLIRLNIRILHSSVWLRGAIIVSGIALSFAVVGYFFSTNQIKVVQFASGVNANYIDITGSYRVNSSAADRESIRKDLIDEVVKNSAVRQIFPLGDGINYFVILAKAHERGDYLAIDVKEDLANVLQNRVGDRLFEFTTAVDFAGPPEENFLVTLSVKNRDAQTLRSASIAVADTLDKVCLHNGAVSIADECAGERVVVKTDDGYTDQVNSIVEVVVDRDALQRYQLAIPGAPLTALVNSLLRQQFHIHDDPLATVTLNGIETAMYVDPDTTVPQTVDDMKNSIVYASAQGVVRLSDIATIRQVQSSAAIKRVKGETIAVVQAKLASDYNDQSTASQVTNAVLEYYQNHDDRLQALGITKDQIGVYSAGDTASTNKSFGELFAALGLAVLFTYIVLVLFFGSFTQPLVILFTIPLSFIGIFPALRYIGNGQFGFLEIIGMIILVGIVENVAIFLIDAARQQQAQGVDDITAISQAAGLRLRPVLLTKFTALASLTPLAILSETYRSISIVIIFGLLTSGFTSLITTPILYVFFRWLSRRFAAASAIHKILFFFVAPVYLIVWGVQDRTRKGDSVQ